MYKCDGAAGASISISIKEFRQFDDFWVRLCDDDDDGDDDDDDDDDDNDELT